MELKNDPSYTNAGGMAIVKRPVLNFEVQSLVDGLSVLQVETPMRAGVKPAPCDTLLRLLSRGEVYPPQEDLSSPAQNGAMVRIFWIRVPGIFQ